MKKTVAEKNEKNEESNGQEFSFDTLLWILLMALLGYLSYRILLPFLNPIAWGIVLAIIFYPVYLFILKIIKIKPLSAGITLGLILIVIIGPFSYLAFLLIQEIRDISGSLEANVLMQLFENTGLHALLSKILSMFSISEDAFKKSVIESLSTLGRELVSTLKGQLVNLISGIIDFVFMIIAVFFFLINGAEMLEGFGRFLPFTQVHKRRFARQAKGIITSTIYGGVIVGVIQGIIGGCALFLLGISSPVFWGFTMAICSFMPLVGTFIVWGPISFYLIVAGPLWKGIALLLIGVLVISMIDNILRPVFIKGKAKMNFLLLFFSVLGGINFFGFIGLVMGPLVVALFVSVVEAFRYEEESS